MNTYINGEKILSDQDQIFAPNLIDNSSTVTIDNTGTADDYWIALPINKKLAIGSKITVTCTPNKDELITLYGSSDKVSKFNSEQSTKPTGWFAASAQDLFVFPGGKRTSHTFKIADQKDYYYLVLWAGQQNNNYKNILSNVMVQEGKKATPWVPSFSDMGLATIAQITDLKSKMGG